MHTALFNLISEIMLQVFEAKTEFTEQPEHSFVWILGEST